MWAASALKSRSEALIRNALDKAEIAIGGSAPWDIQVHDSRFYDRVFTEGSLGLGESYMDGWWDCERLDEFAHRVFAHRIQEEVRVGASELLELLKIRYANRQTILKSRRVAEQHYELGNEFFRHMLGPSMTYSCAYWASAADLTGAQNDKHALIARKLAVGPRDRVLDIGCGWGSLAYRLAVECGADVTGVTISEKQQSHGAQLCRGLPVDLLCVDYRSETVDRLAPFDKITSVGMFEHVGKRHYRPYMQRVRELLADDGLFLLHTIGNHGRTGVDVWVDRYIFPNSMVPCERDIIEAINGSFVIEDWHSFGHDYDRTLMAWYANFDRYQRSDEYHFDRQFTRMWSFYLLMFAGAFRARNAFQLWQIVLSKSGVKQGYRSVR